MQPVAIMRSRRLEARQACTELVTCTEHQALPPHNLHLTSPNITYIKQLLLQHHWTPLLHHPWRTAGEPPWRPHCWPNRWRRSQRPAAQVAGDGRLGAGVRFSSFLILVVQVIVDLI